MLEHYSAFRKEGNAAICEHMTYVPASLSCPCCFMACSHTVFISQRWPPQVSVQMLLHGGTFSNSLI